MRRALLCLSTALLLALPAAAGTLTGVVRNGTNGAPATGVDVFLVQLQGGMEAVANTKTDSQGRYSFDNPGLGQQPMLVRVNYRGVNFHQSVPPGRNTADVEIFEPTADARVLQVSSRLIVLQPNGSTLLVGEEYSIQNNSNPPAAYYKRDGSFEFRLPEGGELAQVSAWGPSGMPVVQGTIDGGKRRYAIAFAFRPGESGVRISYQLPYSSSEAVLRVPSIYPAQRVLLIAPPTVQVASQGFQPAGTEQGYNVYERNAVPANALFDIAVSGTAPPPSATEQTDTGGSSGGAIQAMPSRLDSLRWVLLGGFAALFILGAGYLWRRPTGVPAAAPASGESIPAAKSSKKAAPAPAKSGPRAEVDRAVNQSLDELKDTLFRLEVRRQAGTISEQEYARERSRAEQVLRDLVRG